MKDKFYHAKRHFVATALLLFATSPLWAQQTESKGYPYQKYEVTFAVGMPIEDASNFFGYPSTSLPNATPLDKYHWGKYYLKEENTSPIFSMGLHYHFSKHWAVGLQASYHHMWRQCYETTTGNHAYSFNLHHTALRRWTMCGEAAIVCLIWKPLTRPVRAILRSCQTMSR